MLRKTTLILAGIAILAFGIGCQETDSRTDSPNAGKRTAEAPPEPQAKATKPTVAEGKVQETMDSGGYTYLKVDLGKGPNWYAGPQTPVAVGDVVVLPTNVMEMRNFHSGTLNRTFELIYFVGTIGKPGGSAAAPMGGEKGTRAPAAAPDADLTGIEKAEGGLTVAEIFKAGSGAAGQEIVLRGKVVKYNAGILGKNWLHVRDGTGAAGTNDITITTSDTAKVGDIVLITGKLAADRDFGHGYTYALLIEDAKVVVE